jgi:uncharacterized radical SAM superfamily Fe-S cluster-containing enzyme
VTLDRSARDESDLPGTGARATGTAVRHGRKIKATTSLCPECLEHIDATVSEVEGEVWMHKTCPRHGRFETLLSSDIRSYVESPVAMNVSTGCCGGSCDAPAAAISTPDGAGWTNHSCTVLIEITERCNLSCPTCFAGSSPRHSTMMSIETYRTRLEGLIDGGKRAADMIQLSGGEPTVHPRLAEFVELTFSMGFRKVTINTNGIKLAQDVYADRLLACTQAHPDCQLFVYLQFDGFEDKTHVRLRGRADLLSLKQRALANCIDRGIHVHPVMTLTRGINDHEVGEFVSLAADNPAIKHVVIQPAMYSGRYDNPRRTDRMTLADAVGLVCEQFGTFAPEDFGPIPCSDPNCYGVAVAIRGAEDLVPISRYFPRYEDWASEAHRELIGAFTDSLDGPGGFAAAIHWLTSGETTGSLLEDLDDTEVDRILDALIEVQSHDDDAWDRLLTVSIKPFMDAWTYDQDRIDKCCVHILDDEGNPVSFCEFNAVNRPRAAMTEGRDA